MFALQPGERLNDTDFLDSVYNPVLNTQPLLQIHLATKTLSPTRCTLPTWTTNTPSTYTPAGGKQAICYQTAAVLLPDDTP